MKKEAGMLLHISSLPNKYGIGTFGNEANRFIRFLAKSGHHYWQILPLSPTSYKDSPYQSPSFMALNPYFLDFDWLRKLKLLDKEDYKNIQFKEKHSNKIDYEKIFNNKLPILEKTYLKHNLFKEEFSTFCFQNKEWLDDYALYMVLKKHFSYQAWNLWPDEFKFRNKESILNFIEKNYDQINSQKFLQFLTFKAWLELKEYANKMNIKIIGDIPIYTAYDSCSVWVNPNYFYLNDNLDMICVAGCPPDAFSSDGQLWGNPLYHWENLAKDNYSLWVRRMKESQKLYDLIRIDHFRGFSAYYQIDAKATTARDGQWIKGPGYELFSYLKKEIPNLEIIAENLGFLDQDVHDLLEQCGYPGMIIVQFEFSENLFNEFSQNNLIYTGTHDNQTIRSWFDSLTPILQNRAVILFEIYKDKEIHWKIIEKTLEQEPLIAIIPIQDYMGLKDETGRMNTPSTSDGNWQFQLQNHKYLYLKNKIRHLMKKTGRFF